MSVSSVSWASARLCPHFSCFQSANSGRSFSIIPSLTPSVGSTQLFVLVVRFSALNRSCCMHPPHIPNQQQLTHEDQKGSVFFYFFAHCVRSNFLCRSVHFSKKNAFVTATPVSSSAAVFFTGMCAVIRELFIRTNVFSTSLKSTGALWDDESRHFPLALSLRECVQDSKSNK